MGVLRKSWRWGMLAALGLTGVIALGNKVWHDTMDDPLVRQARLAMPGLTAPLKVLLLSDIHVSGPDMPPERLTHIVAQLNRIHPDIILIAGDFISDKPVATRHYPLAEALAPLAGLRPRRGTVAVLGNHDYYRDANAARKQLEQLGIRVLVNQALRLGPLTIGGMTDAGSHKARSDLTIHAMRRLGPPYLYLTHEPDSFVNLPKDIPLMLAGHTHCGQVSLPLIGPPITGSSFGQRYVCGMVKEHGATLIVTAGLGTSDLPFRFGAHGDVWLITLTPTPAPPKP